MARTIHEDRLSGACRVRCRCVATASSTRARRSVEQTMETMTEFLRHFWFRIFHHRGVLVLVHLPFAFLAAFLAFIFSIRRRAASV
jgi:hypothetical protein